MDCLEVAFISNLGPGLVIVPVFVLPVRLDPIRHWFAKGPAGIESEVRDNWCSVLRSFVRRAAWRRNPRTHLAGRFFHRGPPRGRVAIRCAPSSRLCSMEIPEFPNWNAY